MVIADDAPLQQGPERFDALGMNATAYIFRCAVPYLLMRQSSLRQMAVMGRIVCGDKANLVGYDFTDELLMSVEARLLDHATHDVTLARD